MHLKTLKEIDIDYKTILYRSPYDIGVKLQSDGTYKIKDDSRIRVTLPTINYMLERNCKIVILTWVGRPEGREVAELSVKPHARALSELIGKPVQVANNCVGEEVRAQIANLGFGELLMLENTRFHPEEDQADENFAKELAKNGDIVVFDGFPQAHRIHASTTEILKYLPAVAGLYFEKEVTELTKLIKNPVKPYTVIIGGAKISDKVDAINNLIADTDHILVGGGTANVFLKALGKNLGGSFVEDHFVDEKRKEKKDWVVYAGEIMAKYREKIVLPLDVVIANDKDNPSEIKTVEVTEATDLVPEGWLALDIGPKTIEKFSSTIADSKTVFWNGPMGLFENESFSEGTRRIAKAMETSTATTIIGGGDTVEAGQKYTDNSKITHFSLAGGASLEFLAGKKLPVLEMLEKN